ncbi:MAG: DUF805 domain-containing protein [Fibrobacter sp.]|jgi:uncharacterized membrane protein YhaH (DUF805 family)|nr:DUF805 domain-containing protein [Fibrobacter sp.]
MSFESSSAENLSLWGYYTKCLKNYVNFSGRARRKEYWGFYLWNVIICCVLAFIGGGITAVVGDPNFSLALVPYYIYCLIIILPGLGVFVRRLHDVGRSGFWIFISLIPLIGAIVLLVWLCTKGESSDNKYGRNPLAG